MSYVNSKWLNNLRSLTQLAGSTRCKASAVSDVSGSGFSGSATCMHANLKPQNFSSCHFFPSNESRSSQQIQQRLRKTSNTQPSEPREPMTKTLTNLTGFFRLHFWLPEGRPSSPQARCFPHVADLKPAFNKASCIWNPGISTDRSFPPNTYKSYIIEPQYMNPLSTDSTKIEKDIQYMDAGRIELPEAAAASSLILLSSLAAHSCSPCEALGKKRASWTGWEIPTSRTRPR